MLISVSLSWELSWKESLTSTVVSLSSLNESRLLTELSVLVFSVSELSVLNESSTSTSTSVLLESRVISRLSVLNESSTSMVVVVEWSSLELSLKESFTSMSVSTFDSSRVASPPAATTPETSPPAVTFSSPVTTWESLMAPPAATAPSPEAIAVSLSKSSSWSSLTSPSFSKLWLKELSMMLRWSRLCTERSSFTISVTWLM